MWETAIQEKRYSIGTGMENRLQTVQNVLTFSRLRRVENTRAIQNLYK